MSLRVLDDERLGYAVLKFDKALEAQSLSISVRSRLQQGAYLGPDGKWQRLPHYFAAQRIDGDATSTRYRVGPEIVNYMMEFDRVEIATEDKSLREEAEWENAVPEMSARSTHTIYRGPGPTQQEPQRPVAAAPPVPPPPPAPPPEPVQVAPRPPPPRPARPVAPPPPPRPPGGTPPWLSAGLAALVIIGVTAWLMRCQLFGVSCPLIDEPARNLACAEQKLVSAPCDVPNCFATADARARPEAQGVLARGERACRDAQKSPPGPTITVQPGAEGQEAKKALACADAKHAARQDCDVQSACIAPYRAAYPNGQARIDLEVRGHDAVVACAELTAAGRARDCIAQPTATFVLQGCDIQGKCLTPYIRDYPNGPSRSDLERRVDDAARACRSR
ncbi:MAG TPA: hypothetical protein VEK73_11965 [Xanthobacteraceae bacterium]|nr:hypothetical protein [Xanthobacteraceae bacterium]